MNKQNKVFLSILALVVCLVVAYKYVEFYLNKDFTFITYINCDSTMESCFRVEEPDPSTYIIFSDGAPYKKITLPMSLVPRCLVESTCLDFTCEGIDDCSIETCSEDVLEEGELCTSTDDSDGILEDVTEENNLSLD